MTKSSLSASFFDFLLFLPSAFALGALVTVTDTTLAFNFEPDLRVVNLL